MAAKQNHLEHDVIEEVHSKQDSGFDHPLSPYGYGVVSVLALLVIVLLSWSAAVSRRRQ